MAQPTAETVTFFWRPGCVYSSGLRRGLERAGVPLDARNVWEDADAAATLRSLARGNETVPTVLVGPVALINPNLRDVLAMVARHAPGLLAAPQQARSARSARFGLRRRRPRSGPDPPIPSPTTTTPTPRPVDRPASDNEAQVTP